MLKEELELLHGSRLQGTYEAARQQRTCDALGVENTRSCHLGEPSPTGIAVTTTKQRRRAADEVCERMEERFVEGAGGELALRP